MARAVDLTGKTVRALEGAEGVDLDDAADAAGAAAGASERTSCFVGPVSRTVRAGIGCRSVGGRGIQRAPVETRARLGRACTVHVHPAELLVADAPAPADDREDAEGGNDGEG
jgi:hypothetical protein